MSRYPIPPTPAVQREMPHAEVIVGWDPPLQTFFGQVLNPDRPQDQDEIVFWVGTDARPVSTVETLHALIAPYGVLSKAITRRLLDDQMRSGPPTPLQQAVRALLTRTEGAS